MISEESAFPAVILTLSGSDSGVMDRYRQDRRENFAWGALKALSRGDLGEIGRPAVIDIGSGTSWRAKTDVDHGRWQRLVSSAPSARRTSPIVTKRKESGHKVKIDK